ncbi:hypothetical protein [Rhizobium sp. SYY.PMSO]|uniref:hypothetical protein n=1 Tax=Rhizobium sp. SYY.PMSO TaxID=3382192 RepID=UPI00399015EB
MNERDALLQQKLGGLQVVWAEIGRTAAKIARKEKGIGNGSRIAVLLSLLGCGLQYIRHCRHKVGTLLQVHLVKTFRDAIHGVSFARTNIHDIRRDRRSSQLGND